MVEVVPQSQFNAEAAETFFVPQKAEGGRNGGRNGGGTALNRAAAAQLNSEAKHKPVEMFAS